MAIGRRLSRMANHAGPTVRQGWATETGMNWQLGGSSWVVYPQSGYSGVGAHLGAVSQCPCPPFSLHSNGRDPLQSVSSFIEQTWRAGCEGKDGSMPPIIFRCVGSHPAFNPQPLFVSLSLVSDSTCKLSTLNIVASSPLSPLFYARLRAQGFIFF